MRTETHAAAALLGRLGGRRGGAARMASMTAEQRAAFARAGGLASSATRDERLPEQKRQEIARLAAKARWRKARRACT